MKNNLVRAPFHYLTFLACAALVYAMHLSPAIAALKFVNALRLPGWYTHMIPLEDIVYTVDAYYGIFVDYLIPNKMHFYKFNLDGTGIAAGYPVTITGNGYWLPSICWDGTNFGIAYATQTWAEFMVISPKGTTLFGPITLPGIQTPINQHTTAFKVYWTGYGYAVFGLNGTQVVVPGLKGTQTITGTFREEPTATSTEEPIPTPVPAVFYESYLYYWLIDINGNVIVPGKQICHVAPVSFPFKAEEVYYHSEAWNGSEFLVAYYNSEAINGGPATLYRMTDLYGNTVRNDDAVFPLLPATQKNVAWGGTSFAIVGRHPNNYVVRFFSQTGEPLGAETWIGDAAAPDPATVSWDGEKFVAAQAAFYSTPDLTYYTVIWITTYSAQGALIDNKYMLCACSWEYGGASLGDNLKMVGCGKDLFFQGGWTGSGVVGFGPLVYWVTGDSSVVPTPMPPPVPLTTPTPAQPPSTIPTAVNELNGTSFGAGDQITATFKVNIAITRPFNVYAVIIMPGGSMIDAMTLSPKLKPAATNVSGLPAGFSRQLFSTRVPASAPKGEYELVVALFDLNTKIRSRADAFLDVSAKFTIR